MKIVKKQEQKIEVDLFAIYKLLWQKLWIIIIVGLSTALAAFVFTALFIPPKYSAAVTLYANNSSSSDVSTNITTQDINASVQLVDTYSAIILSDPVLDQVVAINNLGIKGSELLGSIRVSSVNNTEVFKITVEHLSPEAAMTIANSIADIATSKIPSIVEGCSVKIVSEAKLPEHESSPNYKMTLALGFVLGLVASIMVIFISSSLDTKIKGEHDLHTWDYPVLGNIPAFADAEKSGRYGYGYAAAAKGRM